MSRLIDITTPLDKDVLLVRTMRGTEEMSRLFEYELMLVSPDGEINFDDLLGKGVTLALEKADGTVRHFHGLVNRMSQGGKEGRYHAYYATVRPWLWFLTRTRNYRIFQEKTVPDVLKEIFALHPIADVKFELTETYTPWTYCVQYNESDFDFVSRLMEHEGIFYFFTHEEGRHTLVIADSYSAHGKAYEEEVRYLPPEQRVRPEEEHVSSWSFARELRSGKYALSSYDFEKPSVDLQVKSTIPREHALADYEVFEYGGDYIERGDGEAYVRARIEEEQAKFERVQGATNGRAMAPGFLFTLSLHPRSDQNAEYLIVSATYDIKSGEHEARDDAGSSYACTFAALNTKYPFRAERLTEKPIVKGPQTAVVVGPSGEDIYTDKFGRIKVHFYWDRYGKRDDQSSCWIRVSQNWGGKGWGGMFIPHVGQEVIVMFEGGDPDLPIISGRVYNAENMPPVELPGGKTQSIIRDHGGNQIIMEGDAGKERMILHSPYSATTVSIGAPRNPKNGFSMTTSAFCTFIVGSDYFTSIAGDDVKETTGNTMSTLHGNEFTIIDGNRAEEVQGNEQVHVKGTNTVSTLGAKTEFIVGSNVLNALALTVSNIGGVMLTNVRAAQVESIKGPKAESYAQAYRQSKAFIKEKTQVLALITQLHRMEASTTKLEGKILSEEISGKVQISSPKYNCKADKVFFDSATFKAVCKTLMQGSMKQKGGKASLAGGTVKCDE